MNNPEEAKIELSDYWAIVTRRKRWLIVPFALVMGASCALAFLLPTVYRSEATILIQRQSIPGTLVESTVTMYVQEQIQLIKQRIASYDNLMGIAKTFDLYPGERRSNPASVVAKVAKSIDVKMVDVATTDPNQNGVRYATVAFIVAFEASTAETARVVTEKLAGSYLEEHKVGREQQAAEVSAFLEAEAERIKAEIGTLEKAQANFKQREKNQLPELRSMNLNLYEKTQQQIDESKEVSRGLQDKYDAAAAELSLTEPYKDVVNEAGKRVLSAADRLSFLTSEYLQASARYSPEHPDILRLSREIRVLAQQTGAGARVDELMSQLARLQEQLRQARQKYSDDHPEVIQLEKAVAALEKGFQAMLISPEGARPTATPPDNPRYVALKTEMDATQSNLHAEVQRRASLEAKLAEYEARLYQTPLVERDFKSLSRDYDNALQK